MMEWNKQPPQQAAQPEELNGNGGGNLNVNSGGMFVKVMTDEQMEVLRKQIAVYATICEQLVELHKSLTSQHDLAGARLVNLYCDPLVTSGGHKITGRQRWTPTPVQLQILERIFDQGNGAPSKQKIKEITSELCQHGQISETNVYNWFQNRRARSKRKQQATQTNNAESEVETEVESPNEKKTKPEDFQPPHIASSRAAEDLCFQNPEASSAMHSMDPRGSKPEPLLPPEGSSNHSGNFGQMSFYGSMLGNQTYDTMKLLGNLTNAGMDNLIGKMEVPGNYNPYLQPDDYNMTS